MSVNRNWRWQTRIYGVVLVVVLGMLLGGGSALAQGGDDPAPTPFYTTEADPALNARMDHVEQATSILRALEPQHPVTRAFLTRDELLAYLRAMLDVEYPPARARDDAIFYHAFDFMGLDVDLRQLQLDVLAEQVGGFYDTDLKAMFVISAEAELSAINQVLYAHEFTHALQDQHYGLDDMGMDEADIAANPDAALAAQALVEGDAMLMTEGYQTWMMRSQPGVLFDLLGSVLVVETEALLSAPAILQAELVFPYSAGRDFAYALFVNGEDWSLVNQAYENPPVSSEQVLHPALYFSGEMPLEVNVPALADVLGASWREVWHRPLGEFYLREHLKGTLPAEVASAAAAGWGGDRYRLYFNDETNRTVLVWRTVWDSTSDAAEFAAAYRDYSAQVAGVPAEQPADGAACWQAEDARCLWAAEEAVIIVRAPDLATAADILAVVR